VSPGSESQLPHPSTWFRWHEYLIGRGSRVLDLACGDGRHAIAAAQLGAEVVAIDNDPDKLELGRESAHAAHVTVDWHEADLEQALPDLGVFDAVLAFHYLDRGRMPQFIERVAPGGVFMMETFLVAQRELGWGPQREEHLLRPGELRSLVAPLEPVHGREVFEPVDAERWRAVSGIVAERRA
jgi:SAM-dependent methyltransferase